MERMTSRASKAFHRTSKNLRDSTPPASPDRSRFGSLRQSSRSSRASASQDTMKFQISAPVELISSTNMLSYTSAALRSPSPTGRTASSIGYNPSQLQHQVQPITLAAAAQKAAQQKIQPKVNIASPRPAQYQPPSPASSTGESAKGPLSPELGLAISDVLTPPATPPPDHIPRRSRSSSISKNSTMATSSTRQSGSLQRIRSTSSLSSSVSSGSGHENYKTESEEAGQSPDPRRTTTTFGATQPSYKGPMRNPSGYSGLSVSPTSSPSIISASTMPPPPPRVSAARRSASNPNMKVGQKRAGSSSKSNPFAHELAQVSELAEDMGIDLADSDIMIRKGLQKFSVKDYLAVIRDVMLFPLDFDDETASTVSAAPVVPERRRKPAVFVPERRHVVPTPPHLISPKPVAGQSVAVGGWI